MSIDWKRMAAFALALSPLGMAPPAAAGTHSQASAEGSLEIPLGKSRVVTSDELIARAMIGSPETADILPVTSHSVYVIGKKMGTTSLTLYDAGGRVTSMMNVAVGPDIDALGQQLRKLIPGDPIEAHIANDSIVLTGLVNNPADAARAVHLAQAFAGDKVINMITLGSSEQVMLEVRFAEVNRTAERNLGINSSMQSSNGNFGAITGVGSALIAGAVPGATLLRPGAINDAFGLFQGAFKAGSVNIQATLNALETRGLAKTLAEPTLVALSGERASFLAGGEFPVPVAQSGTGASATISVEFKPFGVSLGFTPTVLGDGTISMIVEPEVSAIDPTASITVGTITIPGLRTRRASTTLQMRDGESFAIAGLLQKDFKTTINQMPGLGSVPILGALFRSTDFTKDETELLIVVTPHLVAPIQANQVHLPTDRVADPRESDSFLLGQPYHVQKGAQKSAPNPSFNLDVTDPKEDAHAQ